MTATVHWTANTEVDLAGYIVFHGTAPGVYTDTTSVALSPTPQLAYPALQNGVTHYFAVTAFDTSLNSSPKSLEVSKSNPNARRMHPIKVASR